MDRQTAMEEYLLAQRTGMRELRERTAAGESGYPLVLDQIFPESKWEACVNVGVVEIPIRLVVGTKSAGRIHALSAGFAPLLDQGTEFAEKWTDLCQIHLGSTGIRDPIVCYEYLGRFYIQEGNKRLSVLKHFGAAGISAQVYRVMPPRSEEPEIQAYFEFLSFYKNAGIYDVQFTQPGAYGKLLSFLGKEPGETWTDREKRTFSACFYYFTKAFTQLGGDKLKLRPEEAMLVWLEIYPFRDLGQLSDGELKKTLEGLWTDIRISETETPFQLETAEPEGKANLFSRLIGGITNYLHVAFVHQLDDNTSPWVKGHTEGIRHLERVLGEKLTIRNYFHADSPEETEALLEQAVAEGAEVIFTTTPLLGKATVRMALKYPKVRFLNCAVAVPHAGIRSYYSRIYEGKFITGAIAGAMANNDKIGYVGSYPIFGVPASINAFALGAQMTNPRAKIHLQWSCSTPNPVEAFIREGVQVISNRDVPTRDQRYLQFGEYGIYAVEADQSLTALASPCWMWGVFYEKLIRSILSGSWEKNASHPVNYWWGMDSGVIDVELAEHLPEGVRMLAGLLRSQLRQGRLDPFRRRIVTQDGSVIDGRGQGLTTEELLQMNWLCENVVGDIPAYHTLQPYAQPLVRQLGIYRDTLPPEKETEGL